MARSGVSVEVRGTADLQRLSASLANAANGGALRRDLRRNIRAATKPAIEEAKGSLRTGLPKRGGLAEYFGRSSIGTRTTMSGRSVGVRIVAQKKGHDIRGLNEGAIRHPLFGNRNHWYRQAVTPHLISDPLEHSKPEVQRGVLRAMDDLADRIARSN